MNFLENIQEETQTNETVNPFIKVFERVWAPEEVFFATCLSILGILNSNNIQTTSLMNVKWDNRAKGKDRAHPIVYPKLTKHIVDMCKEEGSLFLRKIKNEINLQDWIRIVLGACEKRKYGVADGNDFDGRKKMKGEVQGGK